MAEGDSNMIETTKIICKLFIGTGLIFILLYLCYNSVKVYKYNTKRSSMYDNYYHRTVYRRNRCIIKILLSVIFAIGLLLGYIFI